MDQAEPTLVETAVGGWGVLAAGGIPAGLEEYCARAGMVDRLAGERDDDGWLFVGVACPGEDWRSSGGRCCGSHGARSRPTAVWRCPPMACSPANAPRASWRG